MGIINVNDIRIYTNHGCMEEEAQIGSDYRVDVHLKADLSVSEKTDELNDTVDYVCIYNIVNEEMQKRAKLLEVVVDRIIGKALEKHNTIEWIKVKVAKINPPIGGDVGSVSVEGKGKRK